MHRQGVQRGEQLPNRTPAVTDRHLQSPEPWHRKGKEWVWSVWCVEATASSKFQVVVRFHRLFGRDLPDDAPTADDASRSINGTSTIPDFKPLNARLGSLVS